jgi:hypothetical protein
MMDVKGTLETEIEKAREEGNWKKVIELATQLKEKGERGETRNIYLTVPVIPMRSTPCKRNAGLLMPIFAYPIPYTVTYLLQFFRSG